MKKNKFKDEKHKEQAEEASVVERKTEQQQYEERVDLQPLQDLTFEDPYRVDGKKPYKHYAWERDDCVGEAKRKGYTKVFDTDIKHPDSNTDGSVTRGNMTLMETSKKRRAELTEISNRKGFHSDMVPVKGEESNIGPTNYMYPGKNSIDIMRRHNRKEKNVNKKFFFT